MTPEEEQLAEVVARAYEAFASYRLRGPIRVCSCPVCMDEATAHALASTPLREIPSRLLAEYTNSAHGYDEERIADELRYFLPRYLELIAADDPPDALGPGIELRWLRLADWRVRWPAAERDVLDGFFDALLRQRLARIELKETIYGWRAGAGVEDALTLAVTAGADLERLLSVWEAIPDPGGAVHAASLRLDCLWINGDPVWRSIFLEPYPEAAAAIGAWLMREQMTERIERVFFAADDDRMREALSAGS